MFDSDSNQPSPQDSFAPSYLQGINLVAPRPVNIEQTGLSHSLLLELLLKVALTINSLLV